MEKENMQNSLSQVVIKEERKGNLIICTTVHIEPKPKPK